MKKQMHPDYHPVVFQDASTGKSFLTRSTVTSERTVEWEDGGMDREFGATESAAFVKKVDFPPSKIIFDAQFAEASK